MKRSIKYVLSAVAAFTISASAAEARELVYGSWVVGHVCARAGRQDVRSAVQRRPNFGD